MIDINELREAIQTFGSQAIDEGCLNELLDRLEEAEKERDELLDCLNEWKALAKSAEKERDAGAQAQPAPSDEYVGWYCAHCERGVDASEVTYHEQHQVCGRVITDDRPPKAQELAANARLIFAAPDLLDALRLIATAQERGFGIDYAKGCALAAIRRATGEQP